MIISAPSSGTLLSRSQSVHQLCQSSCCHWASSETRPLAVHTVSDGRGRRRAGGRYVNVSFQWFNVCLSISPLPPSLSPSLQLPSSLPSLNFSSSLLLFPILLPSSSLLLSSPHPLLQLLCGESGTKVIPAERWCSLSCYHQSEGSGNTAQTADSAFSAEWKTIGCSCAQEKIWIPQTDLSSFPNHLSRNSLGMRL